MTYKGPTKSEIRFRIVFCWVGALLGGVLAVTAPPEVPQVLAGFLGGFMCASYAALTVAFVMLYGRLFPPSHGREATE